MSNLQDENYDAIIFNAADEAVVFNAVSPKASEVAAQGLAEAARILGAGDSLAQVFQY